MLSISINIVNASDSSQLNSFQATASGISVWQDLRLY